MTPKKIALSLTLLIGSLLCNTAFAVGITCKLTTTSKGSIEEAPYPYQVTCSDSSGKNTYTGFLSREEGDKIPKASFELTKLILGGASLYSGEGKDSTPVANPYKTGTFENSATPFSCLMSKATPLTKISYTGCATVPAVCATTALCGEEKEDSNPVFDDRDYNYASTSYHTFLCDAKSDGSCPTLSECKDKPSARFETRYAGYSKSPLGLPVNENKDKFFTPNAPGLPEGSKHVVSLKGDASCSVPVCVQTAYTAPYDDVAPQDFKTDVSFDIFNRSVLFCGAISKAGPTGETVWGCPSAPTCAAEKGKVSVADQKGTSKTSAETPNTYRPDGATIGK